MYQSSHPEPSDDDWARDAEPERVRCPQCRGRKRNRKGRWCRVCGGHGTVPALSREDARSIEAERHYHLYHERKS